MIVARAPEVFVQEVDTYDAVHPSASGEVKIAAGVADSALAGLGIGAPYPRPLPSVPPVPTHPAVLSASAGAPGRPSCWEPPPGGWTAYVCATSASASSGAGCGPGGRHDVDRRGTGPGRRTDPRVQMAKGPRSRSSSPMS